MEGEISVKKTLLPILLLLSFVSAQSAPPESTLIKFSISSCPLSFTIDSLPTHRDGVTVQDTYFLGYIHRMPGESLDWNTSYMVGAPRVDEYGVDYLVPLWVQNNGCVPLDFELTTSARLYDTPLSWWVPSDTSKPAIDKYVLRVLMTGINSGRFFTGDTFRYSGPHSFYYVVSDTPKEIRKRRVFFGPDSAWCCFHDPDLGLAPHPTVTSSGVNLIATRTHAAIDSTAMFLHIMLTTPIGTRFPAYTDERYRRGIIILSIKAKMHDPY